MGPFAWQVRNCPSFRPISTLLLSACGGDSKAAEPSTSSPCEHKICEGKAACDLDGAGHASCVCDRGYAGAACDQCATGFGSHAGDCYTMLERDEPEPAGKHCALGGVAHSSGLDLNGSGALESAEVSKTQYTCAAASTAAACSADACGSHGVCRTGSAGGYTCTCDVGYGGAACDQCATGYARSNNSAPCQEVPTTNQPVAETASTECPNGAYSVQTGKDLNGNGLLEGAEITGTTTLCKVVRTGNFVLGDEAHLLDFADVTDVIGNLTINGPHLTTLAPLTSLIRVEGNVLIQSNPELTNLNGLSNLDTVTGSIVISANASLTDSVLSARVIRGDLQFSYNAQLTHLGVPRLQAVLGKLTITGNPQLISPLGFNSLVSVSQDLTIEGNDALDSVEGLQRLNDTASITIHQNKLLKSLAALSGLETVRGNLIVRDNAALAELGGFPKLRAVDWSLVIDECPTLVSISGFGKLTQLGGALSITANTMLTTISAFAALTNVGGACQDWASQPTVCWAGISPVAYGPDNGGGNYSIIPAVGIGQNDALTSLDLGAISDLTGLLNIVENAALTDFHAKITNIVAGPVLPFLLAKGSGRSEIRDSSGLTKLPLDDLEGGDLVLSNLGTSSLALPKLTSGAINASACKALTQVSLPVAESLGVLALYSNDVLQSISAPQLTSIGVLNLSENAKLASLTGLSSVTAVSRLTIVNNPTLPECTATAFSTAVKASYSTISGNDTTAVCH